MISSDLLQILRCPIDPKRQATLAVADQALECSRCRVRFAVRHGLPSLVAEEAILPEGCTNRDQLPCQSDRLVDAERHDG
jgi:uncharacterized protein YbaR (Trm112 family)